MTFTVRDTTRIESWRFFEPGPGGGNPDYTFAANRLLLQGNLIKGRFSAVAALQYVAIGRLPDGAVGPGALGTGALYFTQSGATRNPQQVYLRLASVGFRRLFGHLDLQIGRQGYASGAESASANAGIELLKRQRIDARLVGEFEWSIFQRVFDGLRVDWRQPAVHVTGVAFVPTQGGFASHAGASLERVRVAGIIATVPGSVRAGGPQPAPARPFEIQGFLWRYDDDRPVTGRPDNTGLVATRADVGITTAGGTAIVARATGKGRVDALAWLAVQRGDWYGQRHAAWAMAAEAGYEWSRARWTPWLRGGWFIASGDDNPADASHQTFFPMLPTVRRFSQTTVFSTMNLRDAFVQILLRPSRVVTLRADWHHLALDNAADRWYAGSGATLRTGGNFGYTGRSSNGSTDLGSSTEVSGAWTVNRYWSLNGFVGSMRGGRVVTQTFRGEHLWFAYIESGLRFDLGVRR